MNFIDEENIYNDIDDNIVDYEGEIRRMMFECYGVKPSSKCLICESAKDDSNDKLFGLTYRGVKLIYHENEIIDYVLEDKAFNEYAKKLYTELDDELDAVILEKWSADYITDELHKFFNQIDVGEVVMFDSFFRKLCEDTDAATLINGQHPLFTEMPYIVRIK